MIQVDRKMTGNNENSSDEIMRRVDGIREKPGFGEDMNAAYEWFGNVCDVFQALGLTVQIHEQAHMEPRTETRTTVERSTRVVPTGDGGVRRETVEHEPVEETVTVGEKKVTTGFYLTVGEETDAEIVKRIADCVGLDVSTAPAYEPGWYKLE